ncbi:glycoside hydrolase family 3 protein [Nocardiopsis sediminis]|uniref:beta-N-acetylhexosaminidase n=1 Tax=Nocardiopsis sediminis TaxID=1778267 RepID=A0ABV8FJX5_9ACTN
MPQRRLTALICTGILLAGAAGCTGGGGGGSESPSPSPSEDPGQAAAEAAAELMADMTVEEKVGQLFVLTAQGTTPEENAELIAEHRPGGLIYFPENLTGAGQIAELSNGLQELAAAEGAGTPLFLGIDQEQGMVARLPVGAHLPDAMAVGATRDPEMAATLAGTTASTLTALGINLDYAPVADVNTDPDNPVIGIRSFGSDPGPVGEMAVAEAAAFAEGGVVSVVKHFPGHGDTDTDSHTGLPVVDKTREEWEQEDLPPFREAVEAGVDAIMTAHLVVPALDDSGEPATLSGTVIDGILRDELGYDGLVTTDALNMEGVRQTHGDGEVAVRAVLAGADQLLMPPDAAGAVSAVREAVADGTISEDRLDDSVRRILALKVERGLYDAEPADPAAAEDAVDAEEHAAAAQQVADASVTLLRNEGGVLPLADGATVHVSGEGAEEIGAALEELGHPLAGSAQGADLAVVGTGGGQGAAAVNAVRGSGTPVVVVGQGAPYDLAELGEVDGYLATYSAVTVSRTAAARAIAGEITPEGRLPVDIPGTGLGIGDGLGY